MKVTIIGVGNMGGAIMQGLTHSKQFTLSAVNPVNPRVSHLAKKLQFQLVNSPAALGQLAPDVVILTTPAPVTVAVARELTSLSDQTVIISAAAGVSQAALKTALPGKPIATMIPNTPVAVNAGTIGLALPDNLAAGVREKVLTVLDVLGDVIEVTEAQLSILGVIGGCGPAFVAVLMDALGDAAVKHGLDRKVANQVVASMVKGTGTLAARTGQAPALLRDAVTSPGGTTIRGVAALEKHGFRYALINAVDQASAD